MCRKFIAFSVQHRPRKIVHTFLRRFWPRCYNTVDVLVYVLTNGKQAGLREKVKAKEQRILDAQKSNLKDEDLEELRNNLAEARIEE
jgi:hypothetical protein